MTPSGFTTYKIDRNGRENLKFYGLVIKFDISISLQKRVYFCLMVYYDVVSMPNHIKQGFIKFGQIVVICERFAYVVC